MLHKMNQECAIKISNVWKIFGNLSKRDFEEISLNEVSKEEALETYDCVIGVADANFEVYSGEIFCIMGLSGSGKSTLVRHINRLLEPTTGSIIVNGQNIIDLSEKDLRIFRNENIGMVFQNFALLPHRTVLENVATSLEIRGMPKNQRVEIAEQMLNTVELTGWSNRFVHELSGGMQQRVGLARALAADTGILLMDEPFSALDPLIRRQLQSEFIKLSSDLKKTTVFITHDLEEAVRVGHRIAIMRAGRIVQIGTPEEIVMNPADNYVAEFVAGISRLKIAKAGSIMSTIEDYEKENGPLPADAVMADESTNLNQLINITSDTSSVLGVTNRAGKIIGAITHNKLLKSVMERPEFLE
jgi:glycine betaine/proline transport system ATP-binding protein|tara:strand:- start:155 stop:1228 length:1074 start_codon:yes stop_codon:yes gene_type:complete